MVDCRYKYACVAASGRITLRNLSRLWDGEKVNIMKFEVFHSSEDSCCGLLI
jgi:hypothetical protein